ncbi:helix-turn-helix transcriptional regulator [Legionella sp. 227]|uniref:helix-turn-helix transcriptional regulator n=1 Tax=Legionella sp. 227 TaxID=3367288 RepID=UPI00370D8937
MIKTNTPPTLIRRKTVEDITTLSRSRIYYLMQQGQFPKPISLGSMSVAWIESEVQEWVSARIAEFRKPMETV